MRRSDLTERVCLFVDGRGDAQRTAGLCRQVSAALAGCGVGQVRVLPFDGRDGLAVANAYWRLARAALALDRPVVRQLRSYSGYGGGGTLWPRPATSTAEASATGTPALAAGGRMRIVPPDRKAFAGLRVVQADLSDPAVAGDQLRLLADELLAEAGRPRTQPAPSGQWHAGDLAVGSWSRATLLVDNLPTHLRTIRLLSQGVDIRPATLRVTVAPDGSATVALGVRPWTSGAVPVEILAAGARPGYAWLSGIRPYRDAAVPAPDGG